MKKIFFFGLLLLSSLSYAQSVDVKWSKPITEKKKHVGFSKVIPGEGKYLYTSMMMGQVGYTIYAERGSAAGVGLIDNGMVAYDRETLNEVAVLDWSGDKKAANGEAPFKDYQMLCAFPVEDKVILFVRDYQRKTRLEKIAIVELTPDLKIIGNLRVVHEVRPMTIEPISETRVFRNAETGEFVLLNEAQGEQDNVLLKYKLLGTDYSVGETGDVNLPFVWDGGYRAKYRDFQWTRDNYLILNAGAREKIENAPRKKNQWLYFNVFTIISLKDGSYGNYTLKSDERKYSGINIETKDGQASILGFYANTNDQGENPVINGFFSSTLDIASGEFINTVTTDFDDDFYVNFKNHYPDRTNSKSKDIPYHYVDGIHIEKRFSSDGKTLLVCTVRNNVNTDNPNVNVVSHCVNRGIISFVLGSDMRIEKYNVIPRVARYPLIHNVDDLEVEKLSDDSYVIVFTSNADLKEVNKEGKPEYKKDAVINSELHYAVMNGSGDLEAKVLPLNAGTLKTGEKFKFFPDQYYADAGKLYVFGSFGPGIPLLQVAIGQFNLK